MQKFRISPGTGSGILILVLLFVPLVLGGPPASRAADTPATAPEADIVAILKRIEAATDGVTSLAAEFIQTKKLAAFDRDLEMTGHLFMQRPDRFAWHVDRPIQYRMVIKDETLFQWDSASDTVQELSLADNPQFTALSGQMELWFSGRYNTLLADYQVTLLNEAPIRLRFHPRQSSLATEFVQSITVTFDGDARYIQKFDLLEANQDRTTIRFSKTRINPILDDGVWDAKEDTGGNTGNNVD